MYPVGPVTRGEEPAGYSYAGLVASASRDDLLDALSGLRFTGWVGPQEGRWVVCVAGRVDGPVAGGGDRLDDVAAALASGTADPVLAAVVVRDRLLRLAAWGGGQLLGRYVSNSAAERPDDDEAFPDPEGSEHAKAFAAACGRPDAGPDLAELLGEVLDEDDEIESERLSRALSLLGLPRWLVGAAALPRDVPGGPRAADLTRLAAGQAGLAGRLREWASRPLRGARARGQ